MSKLSEFGTPVELIPEGWTEEIYDGVLALLDPKFLDRYAAFSPSLGAYCPAGDEEWKCMDLQRFDDAELSWLRYQCSHCSPPVQEPALSISNGQDTEPVNPNRERLDRYMQAAMVNASDHCGMTTRENDALEFALGAMSTADAHLETEAGK